MRMVPVIFFSIASMSRNKGIESSGKNALSPSSITVYKVLITFLNIALITRSTQYASGARSHKLDKQGSKYLFFS